MSSNQSGGCLCGATRYAISGKSEFTLQCYCRDCQQISGSGNLPLYVVKRAEFEITGGDVLFEPVRDPSGTHPYNGVLFFQRRALR